MIVNRPTDTKLDTNVEGERHEMTVDVSNMAHIMSILTDLYSDPEKAVIREYSTNAWDAHVEAGVTRPIEITLPSAMAPFLRIKDYGIGLDNEGIKRIYSQYGASTKRSTNEQNGMLGLGCKSALTYTNQFSLVGVKDGKAHSVVIERDENGVGSMTVAQVLDTDEPNGVTVIIPCKRNNSIEPKAREFFRAWKPGTVLVNGQEPDGYDGLPVGDNMVVIDGSTDYIVMGNVPYPVEQGKLQHGMARGRYGQPSRALVAFVAIGEVNFTPNREALHYTSITDTTLQRLGREFNANIEAAVQRQMDAESTAAEAIKTMIRWRDIMGGNASNHVYSYNGKLVPPRYEGQRILTAPKSSGNFYGSRSRGSSGVEARSVPAQDWPNTLFVYNYKGVKLSADQRRKLNTYIENKGIEGISQLALMADKPDLVWLEHLVDYEATIKPMKLSPQQVRQSTGRIPGSYDLWDAEDGRSKAGVPAAEIDQTRPVFYDNRGCNAGRYDRFLADRYPNCYVVHMPHTRVAKFLRHFPNAKTAETGLDEALAAWKKKITKDDLLALACEASGERHWLKALDPARVNDPKLARAIRIAKRNIDKLERERQCFSRLFYLELDIGLPMWDTPLKPYPLLKRGGYGGLVDTNRNKDHIYIYINAVHAAQTEGA